jgi:hypothetical protein
VFGGATIASGVSLRWNAAPARAFFAAASRVSRDPNPPSLRLVADVPVLAPKRPVKRIRTDLYAINKALS